MVVVLAASYDEDEYQPFIRVHRSRYFCLSSSSSSNYSAGKLFSFSLASSEVLVVSVDLGLLVTSADKACR